MNLIACPPISVGTSWPRPLVPKGGTHTRSARATVPTICGRGDFPLSTKGCQLISVSAALAITEIDRTQSIQNLVERRSTLGSARESLSKGTEGGRDRKGRTMSSVTAADLATLSMVAFGVNPISITDKTPIANDGGS